jgi:hypothetical protein
MRSAVGELLLQPGTTQAPSAAAAVSIWRDRRSRVLAGSGLGLPTAPAPILALSILPGRCGTYAR